MEEKKKKAIMLLCQRCMLPWAWKGDNFWRVNCPRCGSTVTPKKAIIDKRLIPKFEEAYKMIIEYTKKVKADILAQLD